jgi:hypothetical protein
VPELTWKATRNGQLQFSVVDDDSETTITLVPEDDKEVTVRKLRKVLALAEPSDEELKIRFLQESHEVAYGPSPEPPPSAFGWGDQLKKPELPEHAKGDYEIIGEGEE